ncbi:MAG: hypothetical protein HY770_01400, partial [Chitinivibrionia bacterium]|nr:hypothetical protein [Chitinivibrionia bacterium]
MDAEFAPKLIYIAPFEVAANAPFLFRFSLGENGAVDPRERILPRAGIARTPSSIAGGVPHDPFRVLKPLILHQWGGDLMIIDGHRRMHSAFRAGLDRIPALVYPESTPKRSVFDLALSAATESTGMSGVERVLAAFKISCFMLHTHFRGTLPLAAKDIPGVPREIVPSLGRLFERAVSERWLLRSFQMLTVGAEELAMIHSLRLPADHAIPLLDLSASERLWLLKRKETAAMSAAEMRKIAQLMIFARAKPDFSLERFSAALEAAAARHVDGATLIGFFKREVYPELCERERAIAAYMKSMELPAAISIRPPENLEGNSFSCYFTFSSSQEFRHCINALRWAGGDGKI